MINTCWRDRHKIQRRGRNRILIEGKKKEEIPQIYLDGGGKGGTVRTIYRNARRKENKAFDQEKGGFRATTRKKRGGKSYQNRVFY